MNARRRQKKRLLITAAEAQELYIDQGLSINAIAKERGVHPDLLRRDLLYLGVRLRPYRQKPNPFCYDPSGHEILEAVAIGIWLGEGTKAGRRVEVSNSDPVILRTWVAYLLKVCRVDQDKVKLALILHEEALAEPAKQYWRSRLGGFPCRVRFKIGAGGAHKIPMGTVRVMYNCQGLQRRIQQRAMELASTLM
jgi:hypothetical protein